MWIPVCFYLIFALGSYQWAEFSAQRFNFKGTLLFQHSWLHLQLQAWHTQLGLMRNWKGSGSTRGSWYHHIPTSSSPKPLLINLVPPVLQADPGKTLEGTLKDPGRNPEGSWKEPWRIWKEPWRALPSWHLVFQWNVLLKKKKTKIKLEASIRVGLSITEIEVSFHPLQICRNFRHPEVSQCSGYSSALTQAGEPLQTLTRHRDLNTSGSTFPLESSRKEKSTALQQGQTWF